MASTLCFNPRPANRPGATRVCHVVAWVALDVSILARPIGRALQYSYNYIIKRQILLQIREPLAPNLNKGLKYEIWAKLVIDTKRLAEARTCRDFTAA